MEDERSIADPFRRLDAQYFPDNQLGDETLYPPSPAMTVSWAQQTNTVFFKSQHNHMYWEWISTKHHKFIVSLCNKIAPSNIIELVYQQVVFPTQATQIEDEMPPAISPTKPKAAQQIKDSHMAQPILGFMLGPFPRLMMVWWEILRQGPYPLHRHYIPQISTKGKLNPWMY